MSALVFPSLPGLSPDVSREPRYATQIHEAISGRETRVSWRTTPRTVYTLTFNFARVSEAAPSPFAAYNEMSVLLKFLDDHRGAWDDFLFDDPYDAAQVRVRLVEDSIQMVQIVPGVWAVAQLQLATVII